METVEYICNFFFGNFWHWLGLFLIAFVVALPRITVIEKEEDDEPRN